MSTRNFRHVHYLWDDATAAALDPLAASFIDRICWAAIRRITNTGGGNTSAKLDELDPLSGAEDSGNSGSKARAAILARPEREFLISLYLDKLIVPCSRNLRARRIAARRRRPKTRWSR